jgi:thiamine biosynthesis lipoprotein
MTTTITPQRRVWIEQIMGVPIKVQLHGPCAAGAEAELRVGAVYADLRHIDADLRHIDAATASPADSATASPADSAGSVAAEVLALCEEAHWRTEGWFDAHRVPDLAAGNRPHLNPAGLIKGWAVEHAARRLRTFTGHSWRLTAGRDVLVATSPGQRGWQVGVEDPADISRVLRSVTVADGAVATSGGVRVIDPFTGRPAGRVAAVTVVGPSLMWANVYATAAAARGRSAVSWFDTLDGYAALIVDRHGGISTTAGWPVD